MRSRRFAGLVILIGTPLLGCSWPSAREYELQGQVVAVDPARQEITIKHDDIPRFMPGMTMAFRVSERRLLDGRVPGDLVKATLVVGENEAHLRTLERTGFAPVALPETATRVMDLIEPGAPVRDADFVDETGARRRIADWRGRAIAVTFIYTRCPVPTFCPLMDRQFKAVQEEVRRDAGLKRSVALLSVSFDPAHDTPAILAKRAADLQADPAVWRFLTGAAPAIEDFASQFGVSVIRTDPSEIVHNLRTAVIDGDGRLVKVFNGSDWSSSDLVAELRTMRAAPGGQ